MLVSGFINQVPLSVHCLVAKSSIKYQMYLYTKLQQSTKMTISIPSISLNLMRIPFRETKASCPTNSIISCCTSTCRIFKQPIQVSNDIGRY